MASLGDHVVLEAFNEAVVGAATELMESVEEERRVGLFEAHIYFSQGAGKLGSGFEFSPSEAEMVTAFDEPRITLSETQTCTREHSSSSCNGFVGFHGSTNFCSIKAMVFKDPPIVA